MKDDEKQEKNEKQERNHDTFKDDIGDNNFIQKPSLTMRLSVRANFHKYFVLICLSIASLYALMRIPANGLRIYDILGKPSVTKSTSKWWLSVLSHRISESALTTPLYIILALSVIMIIYYFIDAKMTEYNVNFRFIEIKAGVFNRTFDTIDLIHVKDQILERPFIFRLLGISRLIILSNDKSTPVLRISAVDAQKAQLFLDFLRQNAYQSATEYWIAKDRRRRNEKEESGDDDVRPRGGKHGDRVLNSTNDGADDDSGDNN